MKILHCISALSGGGAERQLSYMLPKLVLEGIETHVAYLSEGPDPPDIHENGVILHPISHLNNYDPRILLHLVLLIRRLRPDYLYSCILQMDVLSGLAARLTNTGMLMAMRG